jgi:hypothetical protein
MQRALRGLGFPGRRSESVVADLFVSPQPPSHLPTADPQNLSRLHPADLLCQSTQYHFLYLHCPPQRAFRVVLISGLLPDNLPSRAKADISFAT